MSKKEVYEVFIASALQIVGTVDFKILVENNEDGELVFKLSDLQEGNFGDIEDDEFDTLANVIARLDTYYQDYFYSDVEDREEDGEDIPENDYVKIVIRFLEDCNASEKLSEITPAIYQQYYVDVSPYAGIEPFVKALNMVGSIDDSEAERLLKNDSVKTLYVMSDGAHVVAESYDEAIEIYKKEWRSGDIELVKVTYSQPYVGALAPDKTGDDDMDDYICPRCRIFLASLDDYYEKDPFCSHCGQLIDWDGC